jgi:hypothetical protein
MKLPRYLEQRCLALAGGSVMATAPVPDCHAGVTLSEKVFMHRVLAHAEVRGWLVYHTHDSRRSEPGFPDLLLVRRRLIAAEIKAQTGKLSRAQERWLQAFRECSGVEAFVWRPTDWPEIERVLR